MISFHHNLKIEESIQKEVQQASNKIFYQQPEFINDFYQNTDLISDNIQNFLKDNNFKTIVWCGTGGSYLAAKVISDILEPQSDKKIFFLENLDAIKVQSTIQKINFKDTLFVFASKSGKTADIMILKEALGNSFEDLSSRSLVLTQETESPLRKWAIENKVLCIKLPENICGRYSAFTAIGLLVLNFYASEQLVHWKSGADWALNNKNKINSLTEYYYQSLKQEKWISIFWTYSSVFNSWGDWVQQLWAESLAKNNPNAKRTSTPIAALGSLDQHSLLQQFSDGYKDKSFSFLAFNYPDSVNEGLTVENLGVKFSEVLKVQAQSTYEALKDVPKLMIEINYDNLSCLSALFMQYQLIIPILAELLGVNPFDQPGVEESKLIARKKLGY